MANANSAMTPAGLQSGRARAMVLGFALTALLALLGGFALAAFVPGVAQPWAGAAYAMALLMAIVTGISKCSSA